VETTFRLIKAKFGDRLQCKTEAVQVNEALVLCHNPSLVIQSLYELNITPEPSIFDSEFLGKAQPRFPIEAS
jgi:hypothetical protein